MKKKNLIQFFLAHDYLLFAGHIALAVWQSKWNELRQVSHRTSVQSKEKWSCGEIAARTSDKWWWLSCAEIPAILASFCGDPVYIDFDITPRPPASGEIQQMKSDTTTESLFFPLSQIWFIVFQFSHLFRCSILPLLPPIAASSKNSISFRKWKLHHLRRVSIKLEGRRNGNVKIENLILNTNSSKRMDFRKYECGE